MPKDPVHELFLRAQRGEREALGALVERYLPALMGFVRLQMGELLQARESASDLVQSVCLDLLGDVEHLEYRGEEALRAWLFEMVRNKARQHARYHGAQRRDPAREYRPAMSEEHERALLEYYSSFCSPSQDLAARERIASVEAAFTRLPEQYREVIALAKFVGLSQTELASRMNRSVASVRNLLNRALIRLASLLDAQREDSAES